MKSLPTSSSRLSHCGNPAGLTASPARQATKNSNLKPYCGVLKLDYNPRAFASRTKEPKAHVSIMGFDIGRRADAGNETFTQTVMTDLRNRAAKRVSKKGRRSAGYTHINAFIGFRTYYSRILPNIHQRRLSSYLAKTWSSYIHKDFWTRYTVLYCAEPRSQCFVDWLNQRVDPPYLPVDELLNTIRDMEIGTSQKDTKIPIEAGFDFPQWTDTVQPDSGEAYLDELHLSPLYTEFSTACDIYPFDDFPMKIAETFMDETSNDDLHLEINPALGSSFIAPEALRLGNSWQSDELVLLDERTAPWLLSQAFNAKNEYWTQ
ncbi:hypothetical protein POJ06DRAFT_57136 [Lipomyces tetrasporus]|uniref:Alpha box domain-containing protein n=1 Tax=Lipomyces tetrasporus TaxID=54092 RepID=A0AAD7QWM6_9ASCO|nr:uncharacterized protein POJ06DRAFT_57136 [Lipomyces tetrasporus]KAJ8102853.1 hypothetical protein POJ06DRAFT_57136 [Lipomyces tetrasporus]